MMRNRTSKALALLLACLALFACKKDKQSDISAISEKNDPLAMESELRILALDGRIESGKNSAVYDWVTPFEAATGCKVKASLEEDNESLAASLANHPYDLVIAADSILPPGVFQAIDFSRLRSFENVDKRFTLDAAVQSRMALPLHWKLIKPVPPSTEFVKEVESLHLHAKARNPNCAYAWMEWSLSPKVQADIAAALDTIPVTPSACVGNELLGDDACGQRMAESVTTAVPVTEAPAK